MNKYKNIKITEENIIKKYYAAKKLNSKTIDDSDKTIDDNDNDNKIIDDSDNDNDFYYILNNHKIFKCVLVSIKQK